MCSLWKGTVVFRQETCPRKADNELLLDGYYNRTAFSPLRMVDTFTDGEVRGKVKLIEKMKGSVSESTEESLRSTMRR